MRKQPLVLSITLFIILFSFVISPTKVHATWGVWEHTNEKIWYNDGGVGLGSSTLPGKLGIRENSNYDWVVLEQSAYNSRYLLHNSSDGVKLEFAAYDGTSGQTHWNVFSIVRNGDIQIGHTNDQVNVFLNGYMTARGVTVTTSGWPDYVFEDEYKLMSISDYGRYIRENKHLPGVPDAKEVEGKGLSLGDMQKTQMEKIEEQALYIVELENKVQTLENRLNKLEELLLK